MSNSIIKKLFYKITLMKTITMVGILMTIGIFCLSMEVVLFDEYSGRIIEKILILLSFFFIGLAGLPIIIRREINFGVFNIVGPIAIVFGSILFISGMVLATIPIWGLLLK